MTFTPENILLLGSILIIAAIMISRVGYKFGIPTLLLFLFVGMAFGTDGLGLEFNNYSTAQFIGVVAMTVILFAGGLETDFRSVKPVLKQGIVLSTVGVLLTVLFTGFFIYGMTRWLKFPIELSLTMSLLMAAVMSSTDSASVFSILRDNRMRLKENLQPILELESGSNDPMAYVITIVLIEATHALFAPGPPVSGTAAWPMIWIGAKTLLVQLTVGTALGLGIGYGVSKLLERMTLKNTPLYAILLLAIAFLTMSLTGVLKGNGYLAVYLAGMVIGNRPLVHKKEIFRFMDGMTWIMQIGMFLTLGLLVNPREMLQVAPVALLVGVFLMLVARPLTVFLCLAPFKGLSFKAKTFVSWVGLKGAAPILFATYPILADIPGAHYIFNVVFFITLVSLVSQGMSIPYVAKKLKLDLPEEKKPETFGVAMPEEAGRLQDYTLDESDLAGGDTLKEIELPGEGARVVLIRRGERVIIPDGSVHLKAGDKLVLVIPDRV